MIAKLSALACASLSAAGLVGCSSGGQTSVTAKNAAASQSTTSATTTTTSTTTSTSTATPQLPGTGKPPIVIGDKNFTEQFVLGQLYLLALQAQGFSVTVNRNIGPTDVTIQELTSGRIAMYPEYLQTWLTEVAGLGHSYATRAAAYRAAQGYALSHGMQLLDATPFADTDAVVVTAGYAAANHLRTIGDLHNVVQAMTLGGPIQSQQQPPLLPAIERTYAVVPAAFRQLAIGDQYSALDQGQIQAALAQTTDGQRATGFYKVLADPARVFGWGNVVPVVSLQAVAQEGPVFVETINRVSALLNTQTIRELNFLVDVAGQSSTAVAKRFLSDHGLLQPPAATS